MSRRLARTKPTDRRPQWKITDVCEPPVQTQLLVVRRPDFMHTKPYYCLVTYNKFSTGVEVFRTTNASVGMFYDGKTHVNPYQCPLWCFLGETPELPKEKK